ncbi:hypothetical protein [Desulfosporosinus sp. SB140]|uniref:hypothetical protein n=1 Tax=Desulfosporosinus paludis TaxID=3115649 RepID=UPI00388F8F8A
MIKSFAKFIHKQLLKVAWIRREVEAYRWEQKKQRSREQWAQFMKSGNSVRTEDKRSEVIVDYMDTRRMCQRGVTPTIIRPFGLRRE